MPKTEQQQRYRRRKIEWFNAAKGTTCSNCHGEFIPAQLHFHHLRDKLFVVTKTATYQHSLLELEAEVAKCVVLCANCHIAEHHPHIHPGAPTFREATLPKDAGRGPKIDSVEAAFRRAAAVKPWNTRRS